MPSRMRHGLLISFVAISLVVIGLIVMTSITSYADTTNYVYDELNRLIRVEYGDGTVVLYIYDQAGNRREIAIPFPDTTPPTTSADPQGGFYNTAKIVTLSCSDGYGAGCDKIYYTTDGNDPTTESPVYSSPIDISVTTTLKYFAKDLAGNSEAVKTHDYTIETTAPATTASPTGGFYSTAQAVTLTCDDGTGSGCDKIYYTTDGNDPTTSSPVYSSPIDISATATLKFFAKDVAGNSETVKPETYYIGPESVTTPSNPNGPVNGNVGTSYTYSTGGAASNYGHSLEYLFDWGDGTNSGWLPVGQTSASHSWVLRGSYLIKAQARCSIDPSVVSDWSGTTSVSIVSPMDNDSYTKSLLHMNGPDGSTTFIDSAAGGTHTWTAYGNAQIDTAQSRFGGGSALFDGAADAITTPDATDLRMESGDFTVDFWVRYAAGSTYHTIFDKGYTVSGALLLQTDNSASPKMQVYISGTRLCIESTGATTGAWHHYAVVRYGSGSNNVTIYRDGVATAQGTSTANINNTSGVTIGAKGGTYQYGLNGWLDEFRISKGIARWTSNFTPPTEDGTITINSGAATTDSVNVTLTLTCDDPQGCSEMKFSNDDVDYSTPEAYGTTKSWTLSPGDGTKTVYVKFKDGAGNWSAFYSDSILLDTAPPTGTVTINSGAPSTNNPNVSLSLTCDDANGCLQVKFSNDVDNESNYSTPEPYSGIKIWTLSSGDGTKTVYAKFKDGAGKWSAAYSDTIDLTDLTVSNTISLLHVNGTDGSTTFIDSATGGTHTWAGYGNAQIDTAQSRFGGGSALFDGAADAITTPDAIDLRMESGDFTMDFWVRYASGSRYHTIFDKGYTASGALLLQTDNSASPKMQVYISGTRLCIESTGATTGVWHHYAVVRYGSGSNNVTIYRDGVATAQGTSTANINNTSGVTIGAKGGTYQYGLNGWLDEFRVSKGIARWTSNFTPPNNEY